MTYCWGTQRYEAVCSDVLSVEHIVNVSQLKGVRISFV